MIVHELISPYAAVPDHLTGSDELQNGRHGALSGLLPTRNKLLRAGDAQRKVMTVGVRAGDLRLAYGSMDALQPREDARRETFPIVAKRALFDRKDLLGARGYRWRAIRDDVGSAWTVDVAAEGVDDEVRFLREKIYGADVTPSVTRTFTFTRYSARV